MCNRTLFTPDYAKTTRRRHAMRAILIFLSTLHLSSSLQAMQQSEKMWSLITLNGNSGNIVYYAEPQLRLVYADNPFQQFLANAGIGYAVLPNWQIWIGQTISADSQDAVPGSLEEYRIWQQIIWKHRFESASLVSRTRFEERKSLFFPDWAYRLRQRVLINHPLTTQFSIVLSDEIFVNANQASWIITNTIDQNRAYLGVEQRISAITYLGVGYMNQYLSTPIQQSNHILWLNWRIDLENGN